MVEQFRETGTMETRHSAQQPRRSDEDVDRIRQVFVRSTKKSNSRTGAELQMPLTAVQYSSEERTPETVQ
jgi:hypothetical protein